MLANIDEEVAIYLNENKQLKVEYILEHLEKVEIYPDKVIVIVPLFDVGFIVDKEQYVSREKWSGEDNLPEDDQWTFQTDQWRNRNLWIQRKGFAKSPLTGGMSD